MATCYNHLLRKAGWKSPWRLRNPFFIDHKMVADRKRDSYISNQTHSVQPRRPGAHTHLQWSWLIKKVPLSALQEILAVTHHRTFRTGFTFWGWTLPALHVEEARNKCVFMKVFVSLYVRKLHHLAVTWQFFTFHPFTLLNWNGISYDHSGD